MLANNYSTYTTNTEPIARGLPVNEIDSIFSLIIANTLYFRNEMLGKNYNENNLTQELIIILNQYNCGLPIVLPYLFHPEAYDLHTEDANQKKRIDIAVFTNQQTKGRQILFAIEAKRLSSQLPESREKEYVIGNNGKENGGIQRFKLNHHGKDLPCCGMVGYVEDDTFGNWHTKINTLIVENDELDKELDLKITEEIYSQYESKHTRIDNSIVELRHIWIKMF